MVSAAAVLFLAAPAEARVGHRAAETRAAAGAYASSARMAVDSQDRVTVLWWHFDGSNQRIQAVRLGADGTPGAVQTLDAAGQTAISPQVAIDSEGRATVVWTSIPQDPNASGAIQAVRLGADGTPGPVHTLSTVRFPDHPQVAVDSQDRATVVWAGRPLQSVRLGADGTPGPVQTLSAEHAFDPQVAIDSQDRATVVWEGTNDAADANGIRSVRLGADGAPEAVQTLTPEVASSPQVAIDSQDRATVVWDTLPRPSSKVQSVRLGADGTPGAVQTLFFDASFPQVAIDSQDRATVVWTRAYPGPPGTIGVGTIQSVRLNADGTPGAVHTLSQPDDSAPQLVLRGETQRLGEAVVVQASCDEYCTVLAAGRLKIRDGSSSAAAAGAGKLELKPAMGETSFGWGGVLNPAWLSLKVRKEGRKAAARALKRGKKVVAEIEGAAIDAAGNVDIANRTVKLKR